MSLSSDGAVVAIGGYGDNSNTGATWIFKLQGGTYTQVGSKLIGRDASGTSDIYQGQSVSLSSDGAVVAIGGPGDSSNVGAAWIFRLQDGTYTQVGSKLNGTGYSGTPSQGASVSLSANGSVVAIGGPRDSNSVGATWIFRLQGGTYTQVGSKLVARDASGTSNIYQGQSVSLSSDGAVVAVGGFGDSSDAGAAWIFRLQGGNYTQVGSKLIGSGALGAPTQGVSVSLSSNGAVLAIGGVGDNNFTGAAWIFNLTGANYTQVGKLVGTGAVGSTIRQGQSVSLSSDGSMVVWGAPGDSSFVGAAWIFKLQNGSSYTQYQPKLVGSGASNTSLQGYSVSLSSDGAVVAVGGFADTNNQGATWIFRLLDGTYTQVGNKLIGTSNVYQGYSVSLASDGSTVAFGGRGYNSNQGATWIYQVTGGPVWTLVGSGSLGTPAQGFSVSLSSNGSVVATGGPSDNRAVGATWIFQLTGNSYSQADKLVGAGYSGVTINQGYSVSLSSNGSVVAIGGHLDNNNLGAVWIFQRTGGNYTQVGSKLVGTGASNASNIFQGASVSLSSNGSVVAIGGPGDANNLGAVWIFQRAGGNYTQVGSKLVGTGASNASNIFQGASVSLSSNGSVIAIGGPGDNNDLGAVWIFQRAEGNYTEIAKLVGDGALGASKQGKSVSLSSDGAVVAIGGYGDNSNTGATWIFQRTGGTYRQIAKLIATDYSGTPSQGLSVSLSANGSVVAIGGPGDANGLGAVWIFTWGVL